MTTNDSIPNDGPGADVHFLFKDMAGAQRADVPFLKMATPLEGGGRNLSHF
jgi:hypothetical protein